MRILEPLRPFRIGPTCVSLSLLVSSLGISWPSAIADSDDQVGEKGFEERCAVLIERNIFSRNRPHKYVRPGSRVVREAPPAPPKPEEFSVFTGVVRQGETYAAFIEDAPSGATIKVKVGDAVLRGTIKQISLDSLEYIVGERITKVEIGQNFAGRAGSLRATAPSSSSPPMASPASTTATASAPQGSPSASDSKAPAGAKSSVNAAGSSPEDDVVERMRKRRLEEMKK